MEKQQIEREERRRRRKRFNHGWMTATLRWKREFFLPKKRLLRRHINFNSHHLTSLPLSLSPSLQKFFMDCHQTFSPFLCILPKRGIPSSSPRVDDDEHTSRTHLVKRIGRKSGILVTHSFHHFYVWSFPISGTFDTRNCGGHFILSLTSLVFPFQLQLVPLSVHYRRSLSLTAEHSFQVCFWSSCSFTHSLPFFC